MWNKSSPQMRFLIPERGWYHQTYHLVGRKEQGKKEVKDENRSRNNKEKNGD